MKYMGSKLRIAKYLVPIMLAHRKPLQTWVEPFVGGGNMIDKVTGCRIGADVNSNAIFALQQIRDFVQYLPKCNNEFTEEDYKNLKNGHYIYKEYAGFSFSYGGKWLGGWRRDSSGKRDYVAEAYRNAVVQSSKLQDVILLCTSYEQLDIPSHSLVYCDPPYKHTTKYSQTFNHTPFWQWCRDKVAEGHTLFVSEYEAPEDFVAIWQMDICSSLTKNTGAKKATEKLFVYNER